MKRKKLSEKNQLAAAAYEAAAKQMGNAERFYACCAIDCTGNRGRLVEFQNWFRPAKPLGVAGWWPDTCFFVNPRDSEHPERTMTPHPNPRTGTGRPNRLRRTMKPTNQIASAVFHAALYLGVCYVLAQVLLNFLT